MAQRACSLIRGSGSLASFSKAGRTAGDGWLAAHSSRTWTGSTDTSEAVIRRVWARARQTTSPRSRSHVIAQSDRWVTVTAGSGLGFSVTDGGTVVADSAVLQLKSSLNLEPLFLFGNGVQSNGHFTGALENLVGRSRIAGRRLPKPISPASRLRTTSSTFTSQLAGRFSIASIRLRR